MLQKTMVVVEGVARGFDPKLDIWTTADPVVREWIARNLGPLGQIEGVVHGAGDLGKVLAGLPAIAARSVAVLNQFDQMTRRRAGTVARDRRGHRQSRARRNRWQTAALWVIALTFIGILWSIR